ncbi:MAG: hypothetical protein C4575_09505 [Desulforudis sp.]|nr:MAG: hypothetical protein C4575_09505 [Desulforudis sp.]
MERFGGNFHQSDIKQYLKCPRSFYYNRVLELDKEKVSLGNLAGRAGHRAVEYAHREKEWSPDKLFQVFISALEAEKVKALDKSQELHGAVDVERYRTMLALYAGKPYNREAQVMAAESAFYSEIKPAKTVYSFAGRIDQLLSVPTETLRTDFPRLFSNSAKFADRVLIHRDLKFGRRKETSAFELALNPQIDVYAFALKYGVFYLPDQAAPVTLDLIPDLHAIYYLEDLIPYESDAGTYLKDPDTGGRVPCDLVPEPCRVGKTGKACEGKRAWCTKQKRGEGMYFTTRPAARLEVIPRELMNVCASIRMGHYPRQLGELCFSYCQFRSTCEAEVLAGLEAA